MSIKTLLPLNRRGLMKLVATVAALPAARAQAPAPERPPAPPQRVTKDMIVAAAGVVGLTFKDAEIDMLLPVVNRALVNYEGVRKLDVPLGTAPAVSFSPLVPGFKLPKGVVYRAPKAPVLLKFKQPDELAFFPAVQLGAMVRAKGSPPSPSRRCIWSD